MTRLVGRGLTAGVLAVLAFAQAAHALPYHEITQPTGTRLGVMFVIHGGSWTNVGQQVTIDRRPDAQRFAAAGWEVWNIDYRAGAASIPDVVAFYDEVRRRYGTADRVCAFGVSAGGHLAMMMSVHRAGGVECVIAEAPPTDLTDGKPYGSPNWPTLVWAPGQSAFGPDTRPESPRYLSVLSRVHLSWARNDGWVPDESQVYPYVNTHPGTVVREVAQGPCPCGPWVHSQASSLADVDALHGEQAAFAHGSAPAGGPQLGRAARRPALTVPIVRG